MGSTNTKLKESLKEFFEILDSEEESSNGRIFNPVHISSCRVMLTQRLAKCLKVMRKHSGIDKAKNND